MNQDSHVTQLMKTSKVRHVSGDFVQRGLQKIILAGVIWLFSSALSLGQANDLLSQTHTVTTAMGEVTLLAVPTPNIANVEDVVKDALEAARASAGSLLESGTASTAELATAYGELGELYHVHHVYATAEPCYGNAIVLEPNTFRWVYDLGYLAEQTGQLEKMVKTLRRAIELEPDYAPARLRLAQAYIELNKHDLAEPLLEKTVEIDALRAASLFGLGQIALARRQYAEAIQMLEQALAERPQASRIRYPLAMAYRAQGNIERAKAHLAQRGDGKPEIVDPQVDRLTELLSGARTHFHRAMEAIRTRRYAVAAEAYAAALKQQPDNVNARVSLARSLYLTGDREEAVTQLQEALRLEPEHELANFLQGLLVDEQGEHATAARYYRKTLAVKPLHAGAHHYLGNVLLREGRYAEAAQHFAEAGRQAPQDIPARFMEALSLLRSGASHALVKQRLEALHADHQEQTMLAYALARLLAASPDDRVRNGSRALALTQELTNPFMSPEYTETLAMVYAELGRYEEAITEQNKVIIAAYAAGRFDLLPRLDEMLTRYRKGQPCRVPWSDNDRVFQPLPVDPSGPFRDYPTGAAH